MHAGGNVIAGFRNIEILRKHIELAEQILLRDVVEKIIKRVAKPLSFFPNIGMIAQAVDLFEDIVIVGDHPLDGIAQAGKGERPRRQGELMTGRMRKAVEEETAPAEVGVPSAEDIGV